MKDIFGEDYLIIRKSDYNRLLNRIEELEKVEKEYHDFVTNLSQEAHESSQKMFTDIINFTLNNEIKITPKNSETTEQTPNNIIQKYRKKSVVVEAVQYTRGLEVPAIEFLGGKELGDCETDAATYTMNWWDQSVSIVLKTEEGIVEVADGDYIIKDADGKFHVCKRDIFEKTYEKVD